MYKLIIFENPAESTGKQSLPCMPPKHLRSANTCSITELDYIQTPRTNYQHLAKVLEAKHKKGTIIY
jgi:hypothetical protein